MTYDQVIGSWMVCFPHGVDSIAYTCITNGKKCYVLNQSTKDIYILETSIEVMDDVRTRKWKETNRSLEILELFQKLTT